MKKILALVLTLVMAISFASCACAAYNGEIEIWVPDNLVEFTKAQLETFKASDAEWAGLTFKVEPVGEGDAASNMITDVEGGADVYAFAQDQLARLVASGALEMMLEENAEIVKVENDAGSVAAAMMGDTMYAYPLTSDNGYFLYYDKSVVTDPTTLEGVLAQCEAAGKKFYFEASNGWYLPAFFFGAGCTLTYESDENGNLVACNCDFASENGVKALKGVINMVNSPAFVNGSAADKATEMGAIVTGTWSSEYLQGALGENYAAVKLPTFDGIQLGGFGGFKLMGVKPQTDEDKLAACDAIALFLSSGEVQLARYNATGAGPSNLEAQKNEAVQANVALAALADQLQYCIGQGQYPNNYWTLAGAMGESAMAKEYNGMTDEQLMAVLQNFQDTCMTYVAQ